MTAAPRGWRARLAAAVSVAMACAGISAGAYVPGPAAAGGLLSPTVGRAALAGYARADQVLPPAVLVRTPAGLRPGAIIDEQGRHRGRRALGPDAAVAQVQLPAGPLPRSARLAAALHPGGTVRAAGSAVAPQSRAMIAPVAHGQLQPAGQKPAPVPQDQMAAGPHGTAAATAMPAPRWRALLEGRWQARLREVTELSLAYYETAERTQGDPTSGDHATAPRLLREAVTARRALADTEDALNRLSAGRYGRCEQCAAAIPARRLTLTPEARYCPRCAPEPPVARPAASEPAQWAFSATRQHARPPMSSGNPLGRLG